MNSKITNGLAVTAGIVVLFTWLFFRMTAPSEDIGQVIEAQGRPELMPGQSMAVLVPYLFLYLVATFSALAMFVYRFVKPRFSIVWSIVSATVGIVLAWLLEIKMAALPQVDFSQLGYLSIWQIAMPDVIIVMLAGALFIWESGEKARKAAVGFAGFLTLAYFIIQIITHSAQPFGLTKRFDQLSPCEGVQGCVSSKDGMAPIKYIGGNRTQTEGVLGNVLIMYKHEVRKDTNNYMHIVMASDFLRFQDDLEILFDDSLGVMHFKATPRLAWGDFGKCEERMKEIQKRMKN